MTHTKGNWKVWGDNRDLISAGDDKGMIAEVINHSFKKWRRPEREVRANALLIAAAPELLEACKLAKGLLEGLDSAEIHKLGSVYEDIKEAITKAEG